MIILPKTEDSGVISLAHPWFMISRSAREVCHNFPIISPLYPHSILVGGFNHLDKYESQWEGLSHILWKINYFTSCDPHHDIYTFCYWQIFWHSIWHIFWHSIWHTLPKTNQDVICKILDPNITAAQPHIHVSGKMQLGHCWKNFLT